MLTLLLATWFALPLYPLNPVEQDTLNQMNVHFTIGVNGPNKIADPGLQFSAKYEFLVAHPIVLRGAADYGFQDLSSRQYPDGRLHSLILSTEALYYRGTDNLTGFVGLGAVFYNGFIRLDDGIGNHTINDMQVTDLSVRPRLGLRATFGLRFSRNISIELAITDVRPSIVSTGRVNSASYREIAERIKLNEVRFTLGYLFSLRS